MNVVMDKEQCVLGLDLLQIEEQSGQFYTHAAFLVKCGSDIH